MAGINSIAAPSAHSTIPKGDSATGYFFARPANAGHHDPQCEADAAVDDSTPDLVFGGPSPSTSQSTNNENEDLATQEFTALAHTSKTWTCQATILSRPLPSRTSTTPPMPTEQSERSRTTTPELLASALEAKTAAASARLYSPMAAGFARMGQTHQASRGSTPPPPSPPSPVTGLETSLAAAPAQHAAADHTHPNVRARPPPVTQHSAPSALCTVALAALMFDGAS